MKVRDRETVIRWTEGVDSRDTVRHIEKKSVIRNEDDVDGRARVMRDEERVLRGG